MFLQGFLWGWLTWFDGDSVSSPVNGSYDTSIRVPLVCVLRAPFLVPFKRKKMSANKQIKNNDTISMLRSLLLASVPFKSIYLLGNPGCLLFIFTWAKWNRLVHGLGKEQNSGLVTFFPKSSLLFVQVSSIHRKKGAKAWNLLVSKTALKNWNTNLRLEHSDRKNRTTISDLSFLLESFQWNDPKSHIQVEKFITIW